MPSTFTDNLRLVLQATGENSGTWGSLTNDSMIELVDTAVAGVLTKDISGSGDVSLTVNNGADDESRHAVLKLSGVLTGTRNVIVPSVEKVYVVDRSVITSTADVVIKTTGGSGVTLDDTDRTKAIVYCDGTDVISIVDNKEFDPNVLGDLAFLDTVSATEIDDDAVITSKVLNDNITNPKLADMAEDTIKGRVTTGVGDPEDLTPSQARDVMDVYSQTEVDDAITAALNANSAIPKAWVSFSGDGTILDSLNCTSVNRTAAGFYTITWSITMANSNYGVVASGGRNASTSNTNQSLNIDPANLPTTTTTGVVMEGSFFQDVSRGTVTIYGDLA